MQRWSPQIGDPGVTGWLTVLAYALCAMLALAGHEARRWEPKRLRYRLYTIPAVLARGGRQVRLRYAGHHPWVSVLIAALTVLTALDST